MIRQAELRNQIHQMSVAGKPVVIETLDASVADTKGPCQPTRLVRGLNQGGFEAVPRQLLRSREARKARADDHDILGLPQ
jgi:hypothetical protein